MATVRLLFEFLVFATLVFGNNVAQAAEANGVIPAPLPAGHYVHVIAYGCLAILLMLLAIEWLPHRKACFLEGILYMVITITLLSR